MSRVRFIEPEGMIKDCATKKIKKSTIMIVPVHEEVKRCNFCKKEFTYALCFADLRVFSSSMAIVIGPTPPGTGVM